MYKNVGDKLKICAIVSAVIGVFITIYIALNYFDLENYILAGITLLVGAFLSWLSSLGLYSWGEVVSNVNKQTEIQKETLGKIQEYIDKDKTVQVNVSKIETQKESVKPTVKTLEDYIQETENNDNK